MICLVDTKGYFSIRHVRYFFKNLCEWSGVGLYVTT